MQQLLRWVQKNTCTQARTQVSLVPVTLLGPHTEPDHWEGIGGVDIRTVFFSDCTACVILAPQPGIDPLTLNSSIHPHIRSSTDPIISDPKEDRRLLCSFQEDTQHE